MSTIIRKRTFADNFSDYNLTDRSFNQLYISKKSKFNELPAKNGFNNVNKTHNSTIEMLKALYPTISQEVYNIKFKYYITLYY